MQSSNSTFNYASFPDGYDTSNWIYKDFHKSCDVSAYETETEKREVSTSEAGFVYYKWDYNAPYANNTHRSISHKFRSTGVADNFWYGYFHANLSTKIIRIWTTAIAIMRICQATTAPANSTLRLQLGRLRDSSALNIIRHLIMTTTKCSSIISLNPKKVCLP